MKECLLVRRRVEVGIKVVRVYLAKLKSFKAVDEAIAQGSIVYALAVRILQILSLLKIVRIGSNGYCHWWMSPRNLGENIVVTQLMKLDVVGFVFIRIP
jgi:hypothetical protein